MKSNNGENDMCKGEGMGLMTMHKQMGTKDWQTGDKTWWKGDWG